MATADFPYAIGCLRGDDDRALVRRIMGVPPGRRFGGPGRAQEFGPPPGGAPPFGPPPR